MAARSKRKGAQPSELPADWEAVVRQAVQTKPGMTANATAMKKSLPAPYQKLAKQALELALQLAEHGDIFIHRKGKTAQLFVQDPLLELDVLLLGKMSSEPITVDALKSLAGAYSGLLDAWLKRAVEGKKLFEWQIAGAAKSKKKAYATEPDAHGQLQGVLKALRIALPKAAKLGISNEQVARVLLGELGLTPSAVGTSSGGTETRGAGNGKRGVLLGALDRLVKERPRDALLPVGDVRARANLGKDEFDALALELMREGAISLHHHDHPAALTEAERAQLVRDARGTFYIGIAPRSGT